MDVHELAARFEGAKRRGPDSYMVKCPCHQDAKPSLGISEKDGKLLLNCFAGCDTRDILGAVGLTLADLCASTAKADFGGPDRLKEALERWKGKALAALYPYQDEKGRELYCKARFADKDMAVIVADRQAGAFKAGRCGAPPTLYRLPGLLAAVQAGETVFYVEGEKDADTLARLGLPATTAGGANDWRKEYAAYFQGARVVILPDNDEAGQKLAQAVARDLGGVAAAVKVVPTSKAPHGDVTDWLGEGHTKEALLKLCAGAGLQKPAGPALIRAADVPYEPPKWLIGPYFQRGKGTLVQADSGVGKTAFSCAVAAHVSTGRPILSSGVSAPGNVLVVSVEDDLPVLRGRIEADEGDLSRCYFMGNAGGLSMNSPEVEQAIRQIEAKLVILDPLQCFLGAKVDMHRANETRPELAKFFDMCARHDCAALIVSHIGKDGLGKTAVNRALGSVDIPASMRSILHVVRNPEDDNECVAIHVKCSNAPRGRSLAYTIGDRGGIRWTGYSPLTPEDISLLVKRKERGVEYDTEPLVQVFRQLITERPGGGFWAYAEVKEAGMRILGFPPFTTPEDLKGKLNGPLAKQLQEKDGLIITCGHKSNGLRGLRVEQFKAKAHYQMEWGCGRDDRAHTE